MKINELITRLKTIKKVYKKDLNIFIAIPGEDGFTTPYVSVYGDLFKHRDSGLAGIIIVGFRNKLLRKGEPDYWYAPAGFKRGNLNG